MRIGNQSGLTSIWLKSGKKMKQAATAMYYAKQQGKNQLHVFQNEVEYSFDKKVKSFFTLFISKFNKDKNLL